MATTPERLIDPDALTMGAIRDGVLRDRPVAILGLARSGIALVAARRSGDPGAPALISEADLFLRLCPAPTVGVTGTKGKTTTASLLAAVLAGDLSHPVVLGGNIGVPLIERLPELT